MHVFFLLIFHKKTNRVSKYYFILKHIQKHTLLKKIYTVKNKKKKIFNQNESIAQETKPKTQI